MHNQKNCGNTLLRREFWGKVFIVFLVILNTFLVFSIFKTREKLNLAITELNLLANTKDILNIKIDKLTEENQNMQDENVKLKTSLEYYKRKAFHQSKLSSNEIAELKKKGLKNPVKDIRTDLMKRNELIPYEGVLGGTMRFASEIDIHILSTKWVRAYFEDGHIGGCMLLEYQISDDGKILWKVIDSYMNSK